MRIFNTMQQQEQKKPMTSSELSEKTDKLIASVKQLEEKYDEFMADKGAGDADKLMENQTEFWNENVAAIINAITLSEMNDNIVDRCRLLWDNCFFTRFYNGKILGDWPASEAELRKLTILLGIYNLKKLTKLKEQPVNVESKVSDEEPVGETDHSTIDSPSIQQDPQSDFEPRVSDAEPDSESEADWPDHIKDVIDISQDVVPPSMSDAEPNDEEKDVITPTLWPIDHMTQDISDDADLPSISDDEPNSEEEDVDSQEHDEAEPKSDDEPEIDIEVPRRKKKRDYRKLLPHGRKF